MKIKTVALALRWSNLRCCAEEPRRDGEKFMNSIKEDQSIDFNIIKKLAPMIVEGVDNLKKWSENL